MFEHLEMAPPDAILGLNEAFRNDTNRDKINLSVGVYKDENGNTPILEAVKAAERTILETQQSKGYLAIEGLPDFGEAARKMLFGPQHALIGTGKAVSLQTPGGTGALRVAADFLKSKLPASRIWVSRPTWANHPGILAAADRSTQSYAYLNSEGTGLDFASMLDDLQQIPAGDVVLLHACCHNPTGVDPTASEWEQITSVLQERRIIPLVDFAYQGFGTGLDEDAAALRALADSGLEMIVCSSYSKNFGLYSERVGCLTLVAETRDAAQRALSHAKLAVRTNYSNPPQHGAAIVATILNDAALRTQWETELAAMRQRILSMRAQFVASIRDKAPSHDFQFIERQQGMFSFSGLTPMQVDELKNKHSIYIVTAGGRINVAGITAGNIDRLTSCIAGVI